MKLKRFLKNSSGNMAVMFSLAAVPLLLAGGAATDILRANNANTILQSATDSAALAGVAGKNNKLNAAKVTAAVKSFLESNNGYSTLKSVKVASSGFDKNGVFHVKLTGKIETTFMALAGYKTLDVIGYSEVDVGGSALELALVLDTTGSMNAQGRLPALKTAAKNLVEKLLKDKNPVASINIGIVPFATYVNVGLANRNKPWINVPADYNDPQSCGSTYPNATYGNCQNVPYSYQSCSGGGDGLPQTCTTVSGSSQQCDVISYGAPVQQCWPGASHVWRGVVDSRSSSNDTSIGGGEKYQGVMDVFGPNEITDLTDLQSTLDASVDSLAADGETYIPSGLIWGWELLDSSQPYTKAMTDTQKAKVKGTKALVLMTDGDNTKSATYPFHDGSDSVAADAKTAQLCANIKGAGITIYTVAFKVTKPSSKQMLVDCASDPSQAYDAVDDAALVASFGEIAASLTTVRLSK